MYVSIVTMYSPRTRFVRPNRTDREKSRTQMLGGEGFCGDLVFVTRNVLKYYFTSILFPYH